MLGFYFGLYTIFLVIVWGFFIVTKIHIYHFKNFSNYITKVVPILTIIMLFLSILGYFVIIFSDLKNSNYSIDNNKTYDVVEY